MPDDILTAEQVQALRGDYDEAWAMNQISRGTLGTVERVLNSHERLREQRDVALKSDRQWYENFHRELQRADAAEARVALLTAALEIAKRALPVSACDRSADGSGACDYECHDGCLRIKALDALAAATDDSPCDVPKGADAEENK